MKRKAKEEEEMKSESLAKIYEEHQRVEEVKRLQ